MHVGLATWHFPHMGCSCNLESAQYQILATFFFPLDVSELSLKQKQAEVDLGVPYAVFSRRQRLVLRLLP